MLRTYSVSDLISYINWAYFFHAWSIPARFAGITRVHGCDACRRQWVGTYSETDRPMAEETLSLYTDALRELSRLSGHISIRCVVELYPALSQDDDILVFRPQSPVPFRLPMLRQQTPCKEGYCLSLADFISDEDSSKDTIGVFATSVSQAPPPVSAGVLTQARNHAAMSADDYQSLLTQTLSDRLAEAGAERLHEEVRKELWGYAPDEHLTIDELHAERFQGIRPAVGYPCLPDVSLNFLLAELLDFQSVGITLTEHGMMMPHASVSGLMLSSPHARYFSIGHVEDDQLADYARRRGMTTEETRKYLSRG